MKVSQKELGKNAVYLPTSSLDEEIVFTVAIHLSSQTETAENLIVREWKARAPRKYKFPAIKFWCGGPAITKAGELKDVHRSLGNDSVGQTLSGQA